MITLVSLFLIIALTLYMLSPSRQTLWLVSEVCKRGKVRKNVSVRVDGIVVFVGYSSGVLPKLHVRYSPVDYCHIPRNEQQKIVKEMEKSYVQRWWLFTLCQRYGND